MYAYNNETIPLLVRLPEMTGRNKVFKDGKKMNCTCDEDILEDVSNKIGKEFSTKTTLETEYETHIKSEVHDNKTSFHKNETPKKDTNYRCSALIEIESVCFKSKKHNYYPHVFLEECRYRLDNVGLRMDASGESDNMPDESEDEFNSDHESNSDDNESEKSSKKSKKGSKGSD